ncbi:MAG: YhbY family RNA-binding protein [Deltaproteobacteria bacterium]|nr:YhbY family RNA-binding protein [Deltaproteobacteria bacterium]
MTKEQSGEKGKAQPEAVKAQPEEVKEELTSFQQKYLRGLVHGSHALVQVGQGGISNAVIDAIDAALNDHELIKVQMHEPEDKRAMAKELAQRSASTFCGLIGHRVILYRRHPDKPRIKLPRR